GARKRLRRCATRHRCGAITTRCALRCATTRVRGGHTIEAKSAVCKSHSNRTNGGAVPGLAEVADTTDIAIIVRGSSSSERTDRNHVGVASEAKVTDPHIVSFAACGDAACVKAQGGVEGAGKESAGREEAHGCITTGSGAIARVGKHCIVTDR